MIQGWRSYDNVLIPCNFMTFHSCNLVPLPMTVMYHLCIKFTLLYNRQLVARTSELDWSSTSVSAASLVERLNIRTTTQLAAGTTMAPHIQTRDLLTEIAPADADTLARWFSAFDDSSDLESDASSDTGEPGTITVSDTAHDDVDDSLHASQVRNSRGTTGDSNTAGTRRIVQAAEDRMESSAGVACRQDGRLRNGRYYEGRGKPKRLEVETFDTSAMEDLGKPEFWKAQFEERDRVLAKTGKPFYSFADNVLKQGGKVIPPVC